MKKLGRVLFLVLMIAMLSVCLIACDETDGDGATTTTTGDGGTTTTTVSVNPSVKHTVRFIDGMTDKVLRTTKVTHGSPAKLIVSYSDLHYGYKIDEEKYNAAMAQQILKDTDIIIEYVPKTEYTIRLQTDKGEAYTGFEYEFKERLSTDEILAGKDTYIFSDPQNTTQQANDFHTKTLTDRVIVYEGDSIPYMPSAPKTNDEFLKWLVVTNYNADGTKGTTGTEIFTGSAVSQDYVIRPHYKNDGPTVYLNDFGGTNPLLNLNIADRYVAENDYTKHNDAVRGNEYVTYGDDTTRMDAKNGVFRLAHRLGDFIYKDGANILPVPSVNKFTGTDELGTCDVQVDEHIFATWDGGKLYVAIIIRDDTPIQIAESDIALCEQWNEDGTPYNFFAAGDNIDLRFLFGSKQEVAKADNNPDKIDYYPSTENENVVRCISTDRLGRIEHRDAEPSTDTQYEFVTMVDLDGDSTNKERAKQLYENEKNVGYVVGFEFDVEGYINYKYVENGPYADADAYWADNSNLFKIIMSVQINDRFQPLMTKATAGGGASVEAESFWNSDGTRRELHENGIIGIVGCGGQGETKNYSTITIENRSEPDDE